MLKLRTFTALALGALTLVSCGKKEEVASSGGPLHFRVIENWR